MSFEPGKLYVVATPIGNLNDMTPRAIEILQSVDLILAEDTRHSLPLLRHFQIQTRCQAYHEHNELTIIERICEQVLAGESVALISDAGVPLISDPGFPLIKLAHEKQLSIVPIPGACAAVTALSVAGLASDKFCFEGFLPAKSSGRIKALEKLQTEPRTLIFYESPHRIIDSLNDMETVFGASRMAVMAREITKLFETVRKSPISELREFVESDKNQRKGEIVILLAGHIAENNDDEDAELENTLQILMQELPLKQAVNIAIKLTGRKKNQVYPLALSLKNQQD